MIPLRATAFAATVGLAALAGQARGQSEPTGAPTPARIGAIEDDLAAWPEPTASPAAVRAPSLSWRYAGPPPDRVEAPPPRPGSDVFLVPGHYEPSGEDLVWRPAFWSPHQPGWTWSPAAWISGPSGWTFRPGAWSPATAVVTQPGPEPGPGLLPATQPLYANQTVPAYAGAVGPQPTGRSGIAPPRPRNAVRSVLGRLGIGRDVPRRRFP